MDVPPYYFVNFLGMTPLFCSFLLHGKFKKRVKNLLDEGDVV